MMGGENQLAQVVLFLHAIARTCAYTRTSKYRTTTTTTATIIIATGEKTGESLEVKSSVVLTEDLSSVPRTYINALQSPELQF